MDEKELFAPEETMAEEELFEPEVIDEEIIEEGEAGGEPGEPAEAEKTVPLAALHEARNKLREANSRNRKLENIVSRLYESTGASTPEELLNRMDNIELAKVMKSRNIDEDTARFIMGMQNENRELKKQSDKRNFDTEINVLAQNPMYDDILDVRDEVEDYAMQKGLGIKEAYNALYGESRATKMSEAAKREAAEQQKLKDSKKIKGLSQRGSGSAVESEINLTPSELEVARAAGLTPKQYAQYKKKE